MSGPFDRSTAGLYVHVPFCGSPCGYCDFYRVRSPLGVPEGFEELLLAEARHYAESPPIPVDTVFFGGGTPSLLEPERFASLMEGLGKTFSFNSGMEVTLEANPETVTVGRLAQWRGVGVTRLSIGVQSLSPAVLSALGRRASAEETLRAVTLASAAGFDHLSADCMSGVPGQGSGDLERTLGDLAALPLDHLSVYSLELHPKTPLWDAVVKGERTLPDDEAAADLMVRVHEQLESLGFEHYEISNFARPGGRCRHNLRYWLGGETIGIGPSAWSRFRGHLFGNPRSLEAWENALRRGMAPHDSDEALSPERLLDDRVIFGLRVSDGVEEGFVRDLLTSDGRDAEATIAPLLHHGYAALDGGRMRLTLRGFLMSNEVLAYLLPGKWPRGG